MGNKYSNRKLIVDVAVGSLLMGALDFFIWDELPPGYLKAFVVLGAAFIIGILILICDQVETNDPRPTRETFDLCSVFFHCCQP